MDLFFSCPTSASSSSSSIHSSIHSFIAVSADASAPAQESLPSLLLRSLPTYPSVPNLLFDSHNSAGHIPRRVLWTRDRQGHSACHQFIVCSQWLAAALALTRLQPFATDTATPSRRAALDAQASSSRVAHGSQLAETSVLWPGRIRAQLG